jgi:cysteine desulfurase family protein (TIGR01976 family)
MAAFMRTGGSNLGGPFATSRETDDVARAARSAVADLFNAAGPDEIAFGQNMTSITLAVSRALARTWGEGDEIVVTRLDHDANVWPWVMAARESGATVRYADFDVEDGCRLLVDAVASELSNRTRLVAVTYASNAVGTIVDVAGVSAAARSVGALCYVDAVHYTPHGPVDVQASGCDFLVASAYKFFGPHTGVLYGRHEVLDRFDAVKIRPAPDRPPDKWETGTQSFESLAGVTAAVDYLAGLGSGADRRSALRDAMGKIGVYERTLSDRFLAGLAEIPGVSLYGMTESESRTPTFAVAIEGMSPQEASRRLGEVGIFTWAGHYYALEVMESLGVLDEGGLLRIGFVHYSTPEEVDLMLDALDRLAAGKDL